MLHEQMPEPWQSFLAQIDESLQEEVRLHCLASAVTGRMRSRGEAIKGVRTHCLWFIRAK